MAIPQTSPPGWAVALQQTYRNLQQRKANLRLAVLGIGQPLRGDDAAGGWVAQALAGSPFGRLPHALVLEVGPAPENFTGVLRRFQPDWVLLVDAAELGLVPGAVCCLDWRDTAGFSASTHMLPFTMLGQFLTTELQCQVTLIGIQPATLGLGAPLSPCVQKASRAVTQALVILLARVAQARHKQALASRPNG